MAMEGYLNKKGRGKTFSFIKPWSNRFFQIDPYKKELLYYTIDDKKLTRIFKGSISLDNCTVRVVEAADSDGKPYGFEVCAGSTGKDSQDILLLSAEDAATRDKWITAIREVVTSVTQPELEQPETQEHPYLQYGGHFNSQDAKNTMDFQYLHFDEMPRFGSQHQSAMAKHLTPALFRQLQGVVSDKGYSLSNVIMTGVVTPHLGVGATAGDEQCFELFRDLFHPIIRDWHGYDPDTQTHPVDLDYSKLRFSEQQRAVFGEYVVSTRVRAARNISGYSLPAGASPEDREGVEQVLQQAFSGLTGELAGTYYSLGGLTEEQTSFLLGKGFLFQVPSARNLLTGAGAARDWPHNRGIFHNEAHTALCWVNEEDHCRIISMQDGGDIPAVFARFCQLSHALEESAQRNGTRLMRSEKLGFLGTCPSNLGTGLRASVMLHLPCFNQLLLAPPDEQGGEQGGSASASDRLLLEEVCSAFDLQPRGSAGEHSAAEGGKFDVSNKQRLGFSEVQLVQKMIDGVSRVIELERMLAAGSSPAEVRAQLREQGQAS